MKCLHWILFLVLIHVSLTFPFIWIQQTGLDFDEKSFYIPAIHQIRSHWPQVDMVRDSFAAMPPGYPYFLATVSIFTGTDLIALRLVNDAVSLSAIVLFFLWLGRYLSSANAFLFTLPLALNYFFLRASFRVVTDNAGLVLVVAALACLFLLPVSGYRGTAAGILSTMVVATRQLHLWLVAPGLLQLFLAGSERETVTSGSPVQAPAWWKTYGLGLISRLLPLVLIAYLIYLWHGLVPPRWQVVSTQISLAPISYLLAVAGLTGPFFLLSLWSTIRRNLLRDGWVIGAMLLGFTVTLVSPNTYDYAAGRWGGFLWLFVLHMPAIDHRSIFFMLFSPIGTGTIGLIFRLLWISGQRNEALLWGCSVCGWMSTFVVNRQVFHRYYEPMLLVFFAIGCACLLGNIDGYKLRRWPILVLICLEFTVSCVEIYFKPLFLEWKWIVGGL